MEWAVRTLSEERGFLIMYLVHVSESEEHIKFICVIFYCGKEAKDL